MREGQSCAEAVFDRWLLFEMFGVPYHRDADRPPACSDPSPPGVCHHQSEQAREGHGQDEPPRVCRHQSEQTADPYHVVDHSA